MRIALALFAVAVSTSVSAEPRDGQHDFDFEVGSWKIHLKKLESRLHNSHKWIEFDGTSVTKPLWNGKSQVEQFEVDAPGGVHIEGMTVRMYNPATHQWRLYWANQQNGSFDQPVTGEFRGDHGEFYDQEPWEGRMILCRFLWSKITPKTAHFEQAYSDDGGKTWETNWITDQTRVD